MIEVYQMEGCPYCKKVRMKLEELDVTYISVPCSPNSKNWKKLVELGGEEQTPFLHDPKNNIKMYESDEIIAYLEKMYGK